MINLGHWIEKFHLRTDLSRESPLKSITTEIGCSLKGLHNAQRSTYHTLIITASDKNSIHLSKQLTSTLFKTYSKPCVELMPITSFQKTKAKDYCEFKPKLEWGLVATDKYTSHKLTTSKVTEKTATFKQQPQSFWG